MGPYKLEHFTRGLPALEKVFSYVTKDKIKIIYSFICCAEFFDTYFQEAQKILQDNFKNNIFVQVHLDADNHDEGHGVKMLKNLEEERFMTVEEFNQ
eukprot:gene11539-14132_t